MVLGHNTPIYAKEPDAILTQSEQAAYNSELNKVLAGINKNWPDEEKVMYIHDYLVRHIKYDKTFKNYSAYDGLVKKSVVCEGYSKIFEDLCNKVGVPVIRVASNSMAHGWNAVRIRGKWYYVDCTWDDPDQASSNDEYVLHRNLFRSESGIRQTNHTGNDWRVYKDINNTYSKYSSELNRGFKDQTYENMSWHNATRKFVFLNKGIAYFVETFAGLSAYYYKCDGSAPIKIFEMDTDEFTFNYPGELVYDLDNLLSGNGDTISFNTLIYEDQYNITTGKTKRVRESYPQFKYACVYSMVNTGKELIYLDDNDGIIYRDKGNKRTKLIDFRKLQRNVDPEHTNRYYEDMLSLKRNVLNIHTKKADWEYNLDTGKLKLVKGDETAKKGTAQYIKETKETLSPLSKGAKFTSNNITYKVTGKKKVSVSKIKGTKVTIPNTVTYKSIKYTVEGIEEKAAYKGNVKTLVIGKNVKNIGKSAFYKCPTTKITINSTVLKSVGKNAFAVKGTPKTKVPSKYFKSYKKLITNAGYPKKGKITK